MLARPPKPRDSSAQFGALRTNLPIRCRLTCTEHSSDAIATTGSLCGRRRMAKGPDNKPRVRRKHAGALGRISPDCAARTRRCIMLFLLQNSLP